MCVCVPVYMDLCVPMGGFTHVGEGVPACGCVCPCVCGCMYLCWWVGLLVCECHLPGHGEYVPVCAGLYSSMLGRILFLEVCVCVRARRYVHACGCD